MNKKLLIIIGSVLVFLGLIGGGLYYAFGTNQPVEEDNGVEKKRIVEPENVIPVAERPVIFLKPKADGNNIDIIIESVKKDATEAEYTLEYQTGTLVQAQENTIQLGSLPVTETVFLGTCSAGGKCVFHEDIPGGSLRTRFDGGSEAYVLRSNWKYIENTEDESAFSSKDALFQITSEDLASQPYIIIFNGPGYPEGLEGTPVSDPYTLQVSGSLSGTAELTMRAKEEGNLVIMGWDGAEWQEYEGEVDGKAVTAEVELQSLYIVVNKG